MTPGLRSRLSIPALLTLLAACVVPATPPATPEPASVPSSPGVTPTVAPSASPAGQPGSGGIGESVGVQERVTITIVDPES